MANWTSQDAPAQVTTTDHEVLVSKSILKDLEGKSFPVLRSLYADALQEESEAKKDLYLLRKRVANLGTDVETNEEVLLSSAKQRVATALAYIAALKAKLEGNATVTTTTTTPVAVATVK